jgi:hypothetical protein
MFYMNAARIAYTHTYIQVTISIQLQVFFLLPCNTFYICNKLCIVHTLHDRLFYRYVKDLSEFLLIVRCNIFSF